MYAVYAVCSIVSLTEKESGIYSANFDFRLIQYYIFFIWIIDEINKI